MQCEVTTTLFTNPRIISTVSRVVNNRPKYGTFVFLTFWWLLVLIRLKISDNRIDIAELWEENLFGTAFEKEYSPKTEKGKKRCRWRAGCGFFRFKFSANARGNC